MTAVDISPASALRYVARYAPDTRSIIYEGGDLTAAETARLVGRLATTLRRLGVGSGDRVAYHGLNSALLLALHLACASLKAVFVPLNFRLAAKEVQFILNHSDAHTLLVEPGLVEQINEIADHLAVRHCLMIDTDPAAGEVVDPGPGWQLLSEVFADEETLPMACHEDDLAALLYTSGTTGRAKGVMLTHGNLFWNHVNVDSVVLTRRSDVTYAAAPLFHIGGLNAFVLRTLTRGGSVVVRRQFDPEQALADFQELKVSTLFGVPAMFAAISRVPGFAEADLSSVASAIVAGSPVPPSLIREYAERGVMLQQAWGLTETAPFATYLPAWMTLEKTGSAGVPMPHTRLKLVDPATDEEVTEPGVRGELCVTGPNVTQGYWHDPESTERAFDDDGWFHSGDIGYLDADGYVYIVDRLKDMIITGGENVYPVEIEHVLITHPKVREVAVIGAPDPKWGETVVAIVVCEDGADLTLEEARDFLAEDVARYKLPRHLMQVDELPRNGTGKLDKIRMREFIGGDQ